MKPTHDDQAPDTDANNFVALSLPHQSGDAGFGRCASLTPASSEDLVSALASALTIHFAAVAGAAGPAMRSGGGGSVAQIGRSKGCR